MTKPSKYRSVSKFYSSLDSKKQLVQTFNHQLFSVFPQDTVFKAAVFLRFHFQALITESSLLMKHVPGRTYLELQIPS